MIGMQRDIQLMRVRVIVDHRTRGEAAVAIETDGETITEQRLHAAEGLGLEGVAPGRIQLRICDPLDAIAYSAALGNVQFGADE
jgi:hypothetical protein